MRRPFLFLIGLPIFFIASPISCEEITLQEALDLSLHYSPVLGAREEEVFVRRGEEIQAGLLPNPEFDFVADPMFGNGNNRGFQGTEFKYIVSQLFETCGKRCKRREYAKYLKLLASLELQIETNATIAEVKRAFVRLTASQELCKIVEKLKVLCIAQEEQMKEKLALGKVPPKKVAETKMNNAKALLQLRRCEQTLEANRRVLTLLWGCVNKQIEAVGFPFFELCFNSQIELEESLENSPAYLLALLEVETAKKGLALELAKKCPDLMIAAGVDQFSNPNSNCALYLDVSFPLPIFDRNQGGISAAKHRVSKASYEAQESFWKLKGEFLSLIQQLDTSCRSANEIKEHILASAEEAFNSSLHGYQQGKVELIDHIDMERSLLEIKMTYIETLAECHLLEIDLQEMTGENRNE